MPSRLQGSCSIMLVSQHDPANTGICLYILHHDSHPSNLLRSLRPAHLTAVRRQVEVLAVPRRRADVSQSIRRDCDGLECDCGGAHHQQQEAAHEEYRSPFVVNDVDITGCDVAVRSKGSNVCIKVPEILRHAVYAVIDAIAVHALRAVPQVDPGVEQESKVPSEVVRSRRI